MTRKNPNRRRSRGVSLVETMVAIGVLAVVIPLALAAMLKAGDVGNSARAETRAPAIAGQTLMEVQAARAGKSAYFPELVAGETFPQGGQLLGLAVGRDGVVLGPLTQAQYQAGLGQLEGKDVFYLARVSGRLAAEAAGQPELVTVTVDVEYPAVLRPERRTKISFHTKLP